MKENEEPNEFTTEVKNAFVSGYFAADNGEAYLLKASREQPKLYETMKMKDIPESKKVHLGDNV